MNTLPVYILDSLADIDGTFLYPVAPVQILVNFPWYSRLVMFGTDVFNSVKVFPESGRKTFIVTAIRYRIMVLDLEGSNNTVFNKYVHKFEGSPLLFENGILGYRDRSPTLEAYERLEGMPRLMKDHVYCQFIN